MKVIRNYKPKPFRYKDNFNVNYQPYYTLINGMYQFYDKRAQYVAMMKYGIMCQCYRKNINGQLTWCYYDTPITEEQKIFLQKRGKALLRTLPNEQVYIKHECGCTKKKSET